MNVSNIIIIQTCNPSSSFALVSLNSLSHTHRILVLYGLFSTIQNPVISKHSTIPAAFRKRTETTFSTHSEVTKELKSWPSKIKLFHRAEANSHSSSQNISSISRDPKVHFHISVYDIFTLYTLSNYWNKKPCSATQI
jgi:hypothetical protein